MDFNESEELLALRQMTRRLVAGFGHKYYSEQTRAGGKLDALWQALGEAGLLGANIPAEYGGAGAGVVELAVVCEELAAGGCPTLMLILTGAICGSVLTRHGTEDQKRAWLPRFATGTAKMAFAITEPNAGTNSHRLETVASHRGGQDGDGYVVRGQKCFISGADEADAILLVAKMEADAKAKPQLGLFIVPRDAPGLEIQPIAFEIASPEKQFALFLDDVTLPTEARIGGDDGWAAVFAGLNPERITVAATANGIARYALDKAVTYARDRKVWDVPIGAHQGLAHPLAEAKVAVELARLMTAKAAWLYDGGLDAGEAANMAKLGAAEAALQTLDQAIQTLGGNGLTSEYGLADLWGIARLFRTAPVSREMILNFVAQHSLGLPRSY